MPSPSVPDSVPSAPQTLRVEDPLWTGWDVLRIAILAGVSLFAFVFLVTYGAHVLVYREVAWVDVTRYPGLLVLAQFLAYLVVFAFMYSLVKHERGGQFWHALSWNWPGNWAFYLFAGVILSVGLQAFAHLLPMPKHLPIDRFFQTAPEAYALSLFGVTLAPLLEELFFRGFLYPVLARRLGVVAAVVLTALGFGLIHAPQLARAWGPVLVVFLVGLVLTVTRAVTKSVATSLLLHIAYNGTISLMIFAASDGFRHLEKLNQ